MSDCENLIDQLLRETREQVGLAVIAGAAPVAAMHIDLAAFSAGQARVAEQLCDEA